MQRRLVKIGVLGGYRGTGMISYCRIAGNAEVVAICDKYDQWQADLVSTTGYSHTAMNQGVIQEEQGSKL